MKIILSRKGFDSANGGRPSPIMPDGTLLSMPIPSETDALTYSDLGFKGETYASILNRLYPGEDWSGKHCHNDPDIRKNRVCDPQIWEPAFGQVNSAQGTLCNAGVSKGDLFLFFGWYRRIDDNYRFISKKGHNFYDSSDLQVIFGYLQIGDILTEPEKIAAYPWHPHSDSTHYRKNNTLYIPAEKLSFCPELKGYGTLSYRKDRVLTKEGCSRAIWEEKDFLMPENVYGARKNSAKKSGLYYAGIWQELIVMNESEPLLDWVKSIVKP